MARYPKQAAPGLNPLPSNLPRVPRAIMRASREPFDAQLIVKSGQIPDDIHGHVFVMAPSGSVEDGRVSRPGDPVLTGDGVIYRLDFDRPGEAHLKTRFTGSPCFFADRATYRSRNSVYQKMRFSNFGMGRISFSLGFRNELNTAFLAMRFASDTRERLLVSSDNGRPYEIDPHTLQTVTPVGRLTEWRELIGAGVQIGSRVFGSFPFPLIMGTAHPVFDPHTSQMFTVNYGRATMSIFESITALTQDVETLVDAFRILLTRGFKLAFFYLMTWPFLLIGLFQKFWYGARSSNFTYLIRWDGAGDLERWSLVRPDGSPVVIRQTLHQMAVTRDYIVLIDASFKFTPDQLFNTIHPFRRDNKLLEQMARDLLTGPQMPETELYIVRRADLVHGQRPARADERGKEPPTIIARPIEIPPEALHFLADYENPDGQITLHLAHSNAACLAEWLREYDQSAYPPFAPVPRDLLGLIAVGQMDISRHGRYVIDGERGVVNDARLVSSFEKPNTFNVTFFAYRETVPSGLPPPRLEQLYWVTGGFWPELLTKFIYDMYKDYRNRTIPLDQFQQLTGNFKPTTLFRLNTYTMELADYYDFPNTHIGLSPQFVPRRRATPPAPSVDPATDGYIVCTVLVGDNCSEFWIFDAAALSQPLCVLGHEKLAFGLTIHTAWMAEAKPRNASYRITAREDFEPRVRATGNCAIARLFERDVYPHCDE